MSNQLHRRKLRLVFENVSLAELSLIIILSELCLSFWLIHRRSCQNSFLQELKTNLLYIRW